MASLTKAAMRGTEKEGSVPAVRGDFVEVGQAVSLPQVRIDGPYGAPAEDVFSAETAVLVGAGIGKEAFVFFFSRFSNC